MVVLETKGMLTAGNNQYLQPDYLSPLPTTLDAKKSPLALLAQTCSQIGAESSAKPLAGSDKKKDEDKKDAKDHKASPSLEGRRASPAFKPYEHTTSSRRDDDDKGSRTPGNRSSASPSVTSAPATSTSSSTTPSADRKEDSGRRSSSSTSGEGVTSSASTTPIIRSGLEVLAGHPKDLPLGTYKPSGLGAPHLLPPGYPSPLDAHHPALRGAMTHGFMSGGLTHPAFSNSASSYLGSAAAAAAAAAGLAPSFLTSSPYLTYTRVKTGGGGEAVVPVCRDPYCTGCPYSIQNNHLLQSGGACPPSCTQCEQAKAALSAIPGLSPPTSLSSHIPATSAGAAAAAAAAAASLYPPQSAASLLSSATAPRPYVCNWIAGDTYCGKRFSTSEELLQHLRTHTNMSTSDSTSSLNLLSNPLHAHAALLGSAHSALHRPGAAPSSYPPPSMSPLAAAAAAARYHPYSKPPSSLSSSSGMSISLPGLNPYSASALSAAYPPGYPSPYAALYGRPPL